MRWSGLFVALALLLQTIAIPCTTRCATSLSADSHQCCPAQSSAARAAGCCDASLLAKRAGQVTLQSTVIASRSSVLSTVGLYKPAQIAPGCSVVSAWAGVASPLLVLRT